MMLIGVPNVLAWIAMILWPLFGLFLFRIMDHTKAITWGLLLSVMFLPMFVELDFPAVPALDKERIPALTAVVGALLFAPAAFKAAKPGRGYDILIVLWAISSVITSLTNTDPLVFGPRTIQGETLYDAISGSIGIILSWWCPFFLGRVAVQNREQLESVFRSFVKSILIYAPFLLFEMKFSPMTNRIVYGFDQNQISQNFRWGGWRPVVMMRHGITCAMYVLQTLFATVIAKRMGIRPLALSYRVLFYVVMALLIGCKSTGALGFALFFLPFAIWTRPTVILRVATIIAFIEISYPIFRLMELLPIDELLSFFKAAFGTERAYSMEYRFNNEGEVLARAAERIFFGWGGYSRYAIYSATTGQSFTVIDGLWVIQLGNYGLIGFVMHFGLLVFPVFGLRMHWKHIKDSRDRLALSLLALVCVVYVLDFLPNASSDAYLTFLCGILAGLPAKIRQNKARRVAAPAPAPVATSEFPGFGNNPL